MRAYLTYFIAFVCHATGSAVHPLYNNSSATAKAATNASATAQPSVNSNSTYLDIQKWTGRGCTGYTYTDRNVTSQYRLAITNPYVDFSSFKLSRPLRGREQLDFSRNVGLESSDWCEVFLHSYWPWTSPAGCVDFGVDFGPFRCNRIWLN